MLCVKLNSLKIFDGRDYIVLISAYSTVKMPVANMVIRRVVICRKIVLHVKCFSTP